MTHNFLALVTYMGETIVFRIGFEDGYGFLLEKVCGKWTLLKKGCFSLYYSMRTNPRCFLGSEDEFKCLALLVSLFSMDCVDFEVLENGLVKESWQSQSAVGSCSSSANGEVCHPYELVPSFCKHQKKDLLSNRWDTLINGVGQRFDGGAEEFRLCLRKFSIAVAHDFKYSKNYSGRVKAICALKVETGCDWMVSASIDQRDGSFYIRKLHNVHTCNDGQLSVKNRNMTTDLVAKLIEEELRAKGSVRPANVVKDVSSRYGLSISYGSAWNSVEKAKKSVYGTERESFENLKWYAECIIETNPGSHVVLDVDEASRRFQRIFVAFDACIKGFGFCRPLLFLDGTHLKSAYKGHLLSAVGKDGNQGIYPLCFAVVDSENGTNWECFLQNLKQILDPNRLITFISDRNIGLLECLERVFPGSFHGYCMLHIKRNLRDRLSRSHFGKGMRERLIYLFTQCAYAPTVNCFQEVMDVFRRDGGNIVADFLSSTPPEYWANAYFKGNRYGEMCSNAVECFNNWVVLERELPVGSLIDIVRVKLTKQMSDRRSKAEEWTEDICVEINRRLTSLFKEGCCWPVVFCSPGVFEVRSNPSVKVDLSKKFCSCHNWQFNGIPCSHAVVCILKSGLKCSSFVDSWFLSATFKMSYALGIQPVPTLYRPKSLPVEKRVQPPYSKRPPGRPKTKRFRSRGEDVSAITCGRCGREGNHNRRSCTVPLAM